MNINLKMLKNDFKRNRAGNTSLLLFMVLAASLVVAATIVVTMLLTSMMGMYQTAKPPHFLQMHKGEIKEEAIDHFNASYEGVTAWQAVPMIDVYGDNLTVIGKQTFQLSDCRLDISLVKQNKEYDLLLDKERNVLHVNQGEICIPVILLDAYHINLGDIVQFTGNGVTRNFKVTSFAYDAQMNSKLCSSTRMLISDQDFNELFGKVGEKEYLIETYFKDTSLANDYRSAYEKAGLPQNGQAVTYTVIFLLSALTDIMMAIVLILVSVLLVMVAIMCIKYTLMAALEEEIGEIGTMKAIGMSYPDIRNLYLMKYKIMLTAGIGLGFILAIVMSNVFTRHVSNTFGRQPVGAVTFAVPVAACLFVYIVTIHYCKKLLKKIKKVTVVDALVSGKGFSKESRVKDGLYQSQILPVNLLISVRETLYNFSGFIIVFFVMIIVSGIMIVPMNCLNTMKSKEFITYMGSSMNDILIEIETGENLEHRYDNIKKLLSSSADIEEYEELRRVRVKTLNTENKWMNLHIDCGNQAGDKLKYLTGKEPSQENEIALSKLNAEALGKNTGGVIKIDFNGKQKKFIISGIYQDVTSGGYTAKAIYRFAGIGAEKYQFSIQLKDHIDVKEKASEWSKQLGGGYDIEPMEEFINQTLGGVTRQVEVAATAVVIIGIFLAALIVILYMKLRLAKDVAQIAAMKAIGFTNIDVRKQYLYKIMIISIAGITVGTINSNIMGESIVSMVFNMMGLGISKIIFIINPWITYFLFPLLLLAVAAGMTWCSSKQIREYNIITLINE